ncbi:MAG: DUF6456 domain-containing protein [Pseudomonadota bacterium]|nr:DUF6456 domain-containing protein [Pseudomonadota bacterium]
MSHHVQNWSDTWPDWVPDQVRRYIAHTEGGTTIRSLARAVGCHASTVLRQIRQVEEAREDVLYDEALRWLGARTLRPEPDGPPADLPGFRADDSDGPVPTLEKEAVPALRRLAQVGAVLAVATEMDKAVIVRNGADGETHRLGIVDRRVAQALALNRWISCIQPGRLSRYRITTLGRTMLGDLTARAENRASGFAERPAGFSGADPRERDDAPRARFNHAETPVLCLARRRDAKGQPFLTQPLIRAAERIQVDFELAQMEPRVTTNWDDFLTGGVRGGPAGDPPLRGAAAARARVTAALRDLGPGLGDVVLECCCRLQGLETAEKKLGWSARSGKIVLRIALQRLRQHYDSLGDKGGLIG